MAKKLYMVEEHIQQQTTLYSTNYYCHSNSAPHPRSAGARLSLEIFLGRPVI